MAFTKMHGIGNDYVYINCMDGEVDEPEYLAKIMSPRRFSVGSDGVILICPSRVADARMRMFNADGSEGKMCGNGTRCIGKYLYDRGVVKKEVITLETLSGIKTLKLNIKDGAVSTVAVDMGRAITAPADVPVVFDGEKMINEPVSVAGREYRITAVSMGNPHAVTYVDDVKCLDLEAIGPDFENHAIFPERVNTEFVRRISPTELEMRVWERGSGETFACGTGACAVAVASVLNGYSPVGEAITIHLLGGDLKITVSESLEVTMEGPAAFSYDGVFRYEH
ncbi:MAG: diaminopimelate epimerase [Clostridia bacterium]|nr:diaminopimelate epimerase [Clostridia bacterium]